ncbi:MAG: type I restriction enzyme HsdR N-terminal domain-containing protein [Saprospiraceae bacterium]|nr:type I restriction enzyme HsdR N-terminal domain-containing protein [Saprospiraceae bacterium]MDW8482843.1 type I restriction enzyme HsdR N-terminal domain-containing protein [Saprospiraceae bacterium]
MLLQLDFWQFFPRLRRFQRGRQLLVYDPVRRKKVVLTPEEGVRQVVLLYLLEKKKYPPSHIRVEGEVTLNGMLRRCDIAVFDPRPEPWLLIECKSPKVGLTQAVFEQVARYNLALCAPYLAITDGEHTFCARLYPERQAFEFLSDFPDYPSGS